MTNLLGAVTVASVIGHAALGLLALMLAGALVQWLVRRCDD